jgi:predicted Rossmann fold nucleotide-binding protein DprA/Smf involved in DNA uptake
MKEQSSMGIVQFKQADPQYPSSLRTHLANHAPKTITALGNPTILQSKILAFFCSVKCPGHLILKAHDFAQKVKQVDMTVIGGFHSSVERECLRILLCGPQPVIVCPARSLSGMRMRAEYKKPIEEGRLLLLSPFKERQRRNTAETAMERNRFVAALADINFIAHASPNSKTEMFCRELLAWGKPLYTLESDANANLIKLGAKPMNIKRNLDEWDIF